MSLKTLEQFKEHIISSQKTQKDEKINNFLNKVLEEIELSECTNIYDFTVHVQNKGKEGMEDFEKNLFKQMFNPDPNSGSFFYLALDGLLSEFVMFGKTLEFNDGTSLTSPDPLKF